MTNKEKLLQIFRQNQNDYPMATEDLVSMVEKCPFFGERNENHLNNLTEKGLVCVAVLMSYAFAEGQDKVLLGQTGHIGALEGFTNMSN